MPIIISRHGLLNSKQHLNKSGRKFAADFPSILNKINPHITPKIIGLYADGVASPDGYQRCFETIRPLAESVGYSIDTMNTPPDFWKSWLKDWQEAYPGKFGVLCPRLQDGINPIRAAVGLPDWSNACAFKYFGILTKDHTGDGWTWKNYETGQPDIDPPCKG